MKASAHYRLSIAAVAVLASASWPAFAKTGASTTATGSGASITYDAKTDKYCIGNTPSGDTTVTGSMLQHVLCKTQAEWAKEGVTITRR